MRIHSQICEGKSYLACALAHKAGLEGFHACDHRFPRILEELMVARADGRYLKILHAFQKLDVLVLDDFGLTTLDQTQQEISCRSWMTESRNVRPLQPVNRPLNLGISAWPIPRLPMPSWIDLFRPPVAPNSTEIPCENRSRNPKNPGHETFTKRTHSNPGPDVKNLSRK